MSFDFLNPNINYPGSSFMPQGRGVQSPADFLKALQGFTQMKPMGNMGGGAPAMDFTANPAAAYGPGSGWGDKGDVLSKSFLANEGSSGGYGGMSSWLDADWMKDLGNSDFMKLLGGGTNADGTKSMGLGGTLVGGLSALSNFSMGKKQMALMTDQLNFAKDSFAKNWEAQKTSTNSQLEDRQAARVASNPGAYQSVGDYMKKNRIA